MPNTLIFDFDGTLVDSMPYWSGAMLALLDEQGIAYPADIIARITPLGNVGTVAYFRRELGLTLRDEDALTFIVKHMLLHYRDTIPLKAGVAEFIRRMRAKGYTLAVLTASPHVTLDPCLRRHGLFDLFDAVWCCEDFGKVKSDPTIYADVADKLGTPVEDCVFFDDNIHAVATAKAAGMHTVGVYDLSGEGFADELRATAERYILSFEEL